MTSTGKELGLICQIRMLRVKNITKAMVLAWTVIGLPHAVSAAAAKTLYLKSGHTLLEPGGDQPLQRIAIGDGSVAEVRLIEEANDLLFIGKSPGNTDVRLWYQNGDTGYLRLIVRPGAGENRADRGPSVAEVQALLSDISGVTVTKMGDGVLIDGKVANTAHFQRIDAISKGFPGVTSFVVGPKVAKEPTILIKAKLLEVRRSALRDIGINWSDAFAGPTFALFGDIAGTSPAASIPAAGGGGFGQLPTGQSGLHGYLGIQSSLGSLVNLLQTNGDARILAEPTLSCISGGSADFLAGGEVPLPVDQQGGGIAVEFKQYGVKLDVKPVADDTGFISTEVEVEVSSLDASVTVLGLPGFLTRRARTQMNVDQGQTMVIAGLLNSEDAKNVDKVPGLGHVPVLGELFKSRQFRNNETELVVLVTPVIADTRDDQVAAYQQRFEQMQRRSDKALLFELED